MSSEIVSKYVTVTGNQLTIKEDEEIEEVEQEEELADVETIKKKMVEKFRIEEQYYALECANIEEQHTDLFKTLRYGFDKYKRILILSIMPKDRLISYLEKIKLDFHNIDPKIYGASASIVPVHPLSRRSNLSRNSMNSTNILSRKWRGRRVNGIYRMK